MSLQFSNVIASASASPSPTGTPLADWAPCVEGDICSSEWFTCCSSPVTGALQCRPSKNCGPRGSVYVVPDWETCPTKNSRCASEGYECCVSQADIATGKRTCRPSSACQASGSKGVLDLETCSPGSECASEGYICCIAPADLKTKPLADLLPNALILVLLLLLLQPLSLWYKGLILILIKLFALENWFRHRESLTSSLVAREKSSS